MRIRGHEVQLSVMVDGQRQDSLGLVRSLGITPLLEIQREEYLGETSMRRDEIFKGVSGKMEVHFEDVEVFTFARAVIDRARRQDPNVRINIKATFNFVDGGPALVLMNNCFFGEMPIGAASRTDYVTLALDFECEDIQVL